MNRWKGDIMRSEAPRLGSEENGIPFKRVIAEEEQQKYKTRGKWTQKRCKHRRLGKLECFHTDHIGQCGLSCEYSRRRG
jgi:hypothetical protein